MDINERYGISNGDKVLKNFITRLDRFLEKNGFKNAPIGRIGGGIL